MNPKYSQKEKELFTALGFSDMLTQEPAVLYPMVALHLFRVNKTGVAVDSFRRCLNAFHSLTYPRHTEDFDALIVLEDI
jgi:hypothetical protein